MTSFGLLSVPVVPSSSLTSRITSRSEAKFAGMPLALGRSPVPPCARGALFVVAAEPQRRKAPWEDPRAFMKSMRGQKAEPINGADLTEEMTVNFLESIRGTTKDLQYSYEKECKNCKGKGLLPSTSIKCGVCESLGRVREDRTATVKVPPGVKAGSVLRIKGEGNAGRYGGDAGNLFVRIRCPEGNATVRREGDDLYSDTAVTFRDRESDTTVRIVTVDGTEGELKVPKGAKLGSSLRVKGKGAPVLGKDERGDAYFTIKAIKYADE